MKAGKSFTLIMMTALMVSLFAGCGRLIGIQGPSGGRGVDSAPLPAPKPYISRMSGGSQCDTI